MSSHDYDLFVIGAGSGGVRAARIAAGYGAKVAIAEESRVGGTCVIRGCVPKKLLVYASHFREDFADSVGFGWAPGASAFSWGDLIANKDREIDRLNTAYKRTLAQGQVTLIESRAELVDSNTIHCDGRSIVARRILIAVGSWPELPHWPGIEHAITSNEALNLQRFPDRIVIVGGGYVALEFAGIFANLGAETILLYRGEQVLRGFDDDVRNFLAAEMRKKHVDIRVRQEVRGIEKAGARKSIILADGRRIDADQIMVATGRRPNTGNMGLDKAGVALEPSGAVKVDAYSRSNVPNIHAVGDCTNRINLTPVAIKEGHAYADTLFGDKPWPVDHATCPSAIFTSPPVGVVGLSEAKARTGGKPIDIYKSQFRPMKHTLSGRDEMTLMKLVVDRESQVVLGAHMVGMDAPEIIQMLAIAIKMKATKTQLDQTMAIHPTAAEEFVTMRNREPD